MPSAPQLTIDDVPPAGPVVFGPAALTDQQRDGLACVVCGISHLTYTGPSVPVGAVGGGQVFACAPCVPGDEQQLDDGQGGEDEQVVNERPAPGFVCSVPWCTRDHEGGARPLHISGIGETTIGDGDRAYVDISASGPVGDDDRTIGVHLLGGGIATDHPSTFVDIGDAPGLAALLDTLGHGELAGLVADGVAVLRRVIPAPAGEREQREVLDPEGREQQLDDGQGDADRPAGEASISVALIRADTPEQPTAGTTRGGGGERFTVPLTAPDEAVEALRAMDLGNAEEAVAGAVARAVVEELRARRAARHDTTGEAR
ncbi:hypothetical protein DPM19_18120 [Actinomadura craniellae]|uniref:Uncharacterized protein n=1 Tax=Actinomadura craniellae TaxID=2231787 RepID=A0A365H3A7_9ACTN|nr:hypothetical protein [Actinomadura craniellae]RAY13595.1 hypothetical protein DPM19_18120 [Actinomadura craniellae]